jgi:phosphatidylglycerol:prolipoprotein diacylglycerol transferase
MVALAIVTLVLWMVRETKRTVGFSYEPVLTGALIALPSGLLVSKLLHVIDHWEFYAQDPRLILDPAGLTIYGAVIGAALGIGIYSKVSKFPFRHVFDLVVPGLILAQAVGRVGCTLNGCCYGLPTSLPWGVVYTHPDSIAYAASSALPAGMGLHPTQVYEIIYNLIVFGVLLKLRGRLKPNGTLALLYLVLYSAWRLGIGFLREGTPFVADLHQAQLLGIIVIAVAVSLMVRDRINWKSGKLTAEGNPVT